MLTVALVNMNKSIENLEFVYIYLRNPQRKTYFFQLRLLTKFITENLDDINFFRKPKVFRSFRGYKYGALGEHGLLSITE